MYSLKSCQAISCIEWASYSQKLTREEEDEEEDEEDEDEAERARLL